MRTIATSSLEWPASSVRDRLFRLALLSVAAERSIVIVGMRTLLFGLGKIPNLGHAISVV
jgi:hypothetical protein